MIGSLLNNRVFGWNSLFRALESSRDRAVIMRFETQLTDYEWRSITAAFDASLDTLSQPASDALVMCRALGRSMTLPRSIFMTMTAHLHQGDLGAYLEIEEALVSRSLILRDTDADDTLLVFHDLIVDYCYERGREQENPHDVVLGNLLQPDGTDRSAVVDTLRERSAERYWQDELFRHAASSSRYRDVAVEALLDLDWMSGRADSFGADRLILDCSELDDDDHVRRLRDALRSCSHALGRSSEELLIQLDGRLPSELMEILLRRTAAPRGGTFRPRALRKNFTSSGDPTTRTLVFDGSPVRDLTVVADGTRLVARCAAGQIVVFDLPSCRVGYSVTPSSPVTPHAAVQRAPDGAKIYLEPATAFSSWTPSSTACPLWSRRPRCRALCSMSPARAPAGRPSSDGRRSRCTAWKSARPGTTSRWRRSPPADRSPAASFTRSPGCSSSSRPGG